MAKSYAKGKVHSDVDTLATWAREEVQGLRDDTALEILELAKGDAGDRYAQIDEKMKTCTATIAKLQRIIDWCEGTSSDPVE